MKTLIHVHTDYSFDSNLSVDALAWYAQAEGIGCVAVTDHDTIEGAMQLARRTDIKVIIGEEISTSDGHLIGLFLKERIPPKMSARATAIAIREQGGLVLLPHPFAPAMLGGLGTIAWQIANLIDAVEVNNAQNLWRRPDRTADRFAENMQLLKFVGADSHSVESIAPCHQEMADFNGPHEFLASLRLARLARGRHPFSYFVRAAARVAMSLVGLPLPAGFGANVIPKTAGETGRRIGGRRNDDPIHTGCLS